MKNKTIILITILLLSAVLLLSLPLQSSAKATRLNECDAGEVCHWLTHNSSEVYVLCDGGKFDIEINGHDSLLIRCVDND